MSVNTPKRPKTAYYPGCGSFSDQESRIMSEDPSPSTTTPYWPWTGAATNAATGTPLAITTSSPSSSCGSPDTPLTTAVLRTPSTRTKDDHQGDDEAVQFPTPTTSTSLSALHESLLSSSGGREHKRGRPRSESLTNLMMEGSTSPSAIKCKFCNRVFPREKSLAAHLRTHTGERPYVCDYPGCTKSFTQSGQMKTHQRLHTGERPFICAVPACEMRFTHANRHCPVHVNAVLKRDDKFVVKMTPEQNEEVLQWLEKYRAEREDKNTPTRKTPQRSRIITPGSVDKGNAPSSCASANGDGSTPTEPQRTICHSDPFSTQSQKENYPHTPIHGGAAGCLRGDEELISSSTNSAGLKRHPQNDENECPVTPTTPSKNPYKSRKGLMVELDMNAGLAMSPLAPLKMKPQPKLIQWQEPLSQGEEEEEDDEDADTENGTRHYYVNENQANQQQQQHHQAHAPNRLKENRIFSPSKKAAMKQGSSSSTFNPKKKWLREACMEDLAKPLDPTSTAIGDGSVLGSPQKLQIKSMNLLRPTVLMLASRDKLIPLHGSSDQISGQGQQNSNPPSAPSVVAQPEMENSRRWMGKLALMQLATTAASAVSGERVSSTSASGPQPPNGVHGLTTSGFVNDLPEYTQL